MRAGVEKILLLGNFSVRCTICTFCRFWSDFCKNLKNSWCLTMFAKNHRKSKMRAGVEKILSLGNFSLRCTICAFCSFWLDLRKILKTPDALLTILLKITETSKMRVPRFIVMTSIPSFYATNHSSTPYKNFNCCIAEHTSVCRVPGGSIRWKVLSRRTVADNNKRQDLWFFGNTAPVITTGPHAISIWFPTRIWRKHTERKIGNDEKSRNRTNVVLIVFLRGRKKPFLPRFFRTSTSSKIIFSNNGQPPPAPPLQCWVNVRAPPWNSSGTNAWPNIVMGGRGVMNYSCAKNRYHNFVANCRPKLWSFFVLQKNKDFLFWEFFFAIKIEIAISTLKMYTSALRYTEIIHGRKIVLKFKLILGPQFCPYLFAFSRGRYALEIVLTKRSKRKEPQDESSAPTSGPIQCDYATLQWTYSTS